MTLMGMFEGNHITEHHYSAEFLWRFVQTMASLSADPGGLTAVHFSYCNTNFISSLHRSSLKRHLNEVFCLFGFYIFASLRELRCRRVCSFLRLRDFKSGCVDRDMREIQGHDIVSSLIRLNICERETGS